TRGDYAPLVRFVESVMNRCEPEEGDGRIRGWVTTDWEAWEACREPECQPFFFFAGTDWRNRCETAPFCLASLVARRPAEFACEDPESLPDAFGSDFRLLAERNRAALWKDLIEPYFFFKTPPAPDVTVLPVMEFEPLSPTFPGIHYDCPGVSPAMCSLGN